MFCIKGFHCIIPIFQFAANRDSQLSTTSSQSDTTADIFREKTVSLIEPTLPQDM